jgi:outer membrane protein
VFEIYGNNFVSELYSGQLSVEIAQMSLDIAKAGKMPTLSANGSLSTNINSRSENSATEQLRNQISPSMGLNLSVPIVDNRSAKSSKIIAESNLNKAKISLEATRQNIRSQIEQLVADIKSAAARFVSAREQFLAETENMRIIEEMYGMGNLTVIDYASQENNFLSAQSEFTQAKYSLMLSKKLLEIYLSYN